MDTVFLDVFFSKEIAPRAESKYNHRTVLWSQVEFPCRIIVAIFVPGGTYFFTVVTHRRQPFLTTDLARLCLLCNAIRKIRRKFPFEIVATVLLPDHMHAIWTLPPGDSRYPTGWRRIKEEFTRDFLAGGGQELPQSRSRKQHAMRGVWQKRFWEHTCDDEADLKRCVDYVHWNPRKHGLVTNLIDWPWSSFQRFVSLGEYTADWGKTDPIPGYDDPEWE